MSDSEYSNDSCTSQAYANADVLGAISTLLESGAFTIIPHPSCAFLLCPISPEAGQYFADMLPTWSATYPSEEDEENSAPSDPDY